MDDLPKPSRASDPPIRLLRRRVAEFAPVTPKSIALFRLGEVCNHHCPMCSNSGRAEAEQIPTDELLRRADWLKSLGLQRVVVTGGEPTAHPGFWPLVEQLARLEILWDINTNGSRLGDPGAAARCAELGLQRAIVSLHSLVPAVSAEISGTTAKGHQAILAGIDALLAAGVQVMINAVLTTLNLATLEAYLRGCAANWGPEVAVKLVFPSTAGKGGAWPGIQLRYAEVMEPLRVAASLAESLGLELVYENLPPCVVAEHPLRNVSRSGFGESHYLEDLHGRALYSMEHIEAFFSAYPESCRLCARRRGCPGVDESYLRRWGTAEFVPLV